MPLLPLSPVLNSRPSASTSTPSAARTHQQSNLKTAYAALSQELGRPCTSCRLTVTLNDNCVCNACSSMKKARIREEKKKRKSLPAPSTTRKSLPMVSTDIGGIPKHAVAVAAAQVQTSKSCDHVNKKAKMSSSSSITPIDCVYQTDKDLYAYLRRIKARHRRQFTGTYSVIADPKMRTSERIDSVFDALEQHAGVRGRFNMGYSTGPKGHGGQYLCSCTQTCGGKIDVYVDEDNTHPLFSGQKITVEIKH